MRKERESNYDLLRIVSTVAVITIHVSGFYVNSIINSAITEGKLDWGGYIEIFLYNTLSRFAVPCFVMLSGAFILADERNMDFKYFYQKALRQIGIPSVIFSFLYFGVSVLQNYNGSIRSILQCIKRFICGEPFYHMWYLYMLIGVYLLAPIVIRFKRDIGERNFSRVAWLFFVPAILSMWTSQRTFHWDIGYSFCYLGYFMAGYEIRKKSREREHKGNGKGYCLLLAGIMFELATVCIRCVWAGKGNLETDLKYSLAGPFAPLIAAASVCIFMGFSMITVKRDFGKPASRTFYIYLVHAGIWLIGEKVVLAVFGIGSSYRFVIPAGIVLVFLLSYVCAVLCMKRKTSV